MSDPRRLKQGLAAVLRLRDAEDYVAALAKVEEMRAAQPGNARLCILWSDLVQLQEETAHALADAKQVLRLATELDKDSPAALIRMGHFLDAVEDDPKAAAESFAHGAAAARRLLLEGLIGQAKALLQIDKREEARHCVLEALRLLPPGAEPSSGGIHGEEIEGLVAEAFAKRSA